jgi:hypothetical protein
MGIGHWALGIGHWALGIVDFGCPDFGCPGFGFWILILDWLFSSMRYALCAMRHTPCGRMGKTHRCMPNTMMR